MNTLIFKEIEIRNFLSVGNKPVILEFNRGTNFVVGWNNDSSCSNGCGKTTIFYSSILYALFGETGRDIKQANLVNYRNRGKMYVKLILEKDDKEIIVYRGRKPNIFYYTHDGTTYQNDNVYETQSQLNKQLDISEDIFTNVFIINASDVLDFIKEEGSVKLRDRFERIFFKDIIFKRVLETVRREYNLVQKQIDINNSKMKEKLDFLKRLKGFIESSKKAENYEKQLEKYKKQQDTLGHQLVITEERIQQRENSDQVKQLRQKKEEYTSKRDQVTSRIYYFSRKVDEMKNKLDTILASSSICPLCRQPIATHTTDKLKQEYQEEIDLSRQSRAEYEDKKVLCDEKLKKIEQIEGKIQAALDSLKSEQTDVRAKVAEISQQMKYFQENYKDHLGLTQEFSTIKGQLLAVRDENAKLGADISDLELLSALFDNSSGGILNFFVEKVLKILNQIINKFITKMDIDFTFRFDNNLRLKFDLLDTLSLNNFSGGEKKIINFIVLFSLLEFFYNTLSFRPSILVIDEVADTTISSPKVDLIFGIIGDFNKDNNVGVYLLSHNYSVQHNAVLDFDNIIELQKKDGFSSIKNIQGRNAQELEK